MLWSEVCGAAMLRQKRGRRPGDHAVQGSQLCRRPAIRFGDAAGVWGLRVLCAWTVGAAKVEVFPVLQQKCVWTVRMYSTGWGFRAAWAMGRGRVLRFSKKIRFRVFSRVHASSQWSGIPHLFAVRATGEVWLDCGNGFACTQPYTVGRWNMI